MKIRLKKFLNKYKNRIFSFIAVFAFIPLFGFNAYASTEIAGVLENSTVLNTTNDKLTLTGANGSFNATFDKSANAFYFVNTAFSTSYINLHNYNERFDFTFAPSLYDYYLVCSFESGVNNSFYPTIREVSMRLTDSVGVGTGVVFTEYSISRIKDTNTGGFTFVGKFPNMDYSFNNITQIKFVFSSNVTIPADTYFHGHFIAVLKSSDSSVGDVVSAINSQTGTLSGKLDGVQSGISQGNNLIDKGNSSTSGIVSDNDSAADNLDEVVSEYHATEQQFFDDFNTNQQAINSDIVGWSWGGLVNCANWVGSTMTDYYNNMGDFRQYIIYPLMLGIALFFLGRGSSIIGHLYRKPTTSFTHTESRSTMSNGVRHTNTVTTRNGGVFRK